MKIDKTAFDAERIQDEKGTTTTKILPDTETLDLHVSAMLLEMGGWGVPLNTNISGPWVASHGRVMDGKDAIVHHEVNEICHANCFEQADKDNEHWIGYALSSDGLWHEHSWLMKDNQIRETTGMARIAYCGVPINEIPQSSHVLLEGEMVDAEDWKKHKQAARKILEGVPIRTAGESKAIIISAEKVRDEILDDHRKLKQGNLAAMQRWHGQGQGMF